MKVQKGPSLVFCPLIQISSECRRWSADLVMWQSSLGQANASAYRRSLSVSSTTIRYYVYVVILGVCLRFKPHWMFQIYKYVIKGREELTSCSSLIHSHMFLLLYVLYRQAGNLSFGQWRVPPFRELGTQWHQREIPSLSIYLIYHTNGNKQAMLSVNAWSRALWLAGLATRDIQGIWLLKIVGLYAR